MSEKILPLDDLDPYGLAYKVEAIMTRKALKPHGLAFLLAVMAGLFIGLGFVYCSIANATGSGKIVGGLVFSVGLVMVTVYCAELFTSTTMTLISRANKQITWGKMLANWSVVYVGNFVGALVLVGIILVSAHPFDNGGAVGVFYIKTAEHKLAHTFPAAVALGILCNLLVCLGVWMSYAGRSVIDKIAACLLPVGLFIACGFEHSVANMFMVPVGIYTNQMATPEIVAQLGDPAHYTEVLTWGNFFMKNLIPVTIGNIIGGGLMVGMYQWMIYLRPGVERR